MLCILTFLLEEFLEESKKTIKSHIDYTFAIGSFIKVLLKAYINIIFIECFCLSTWFTAVLYLWYCRYGVKYKTYIRVWQTDPWKPDLQLHVCGAIQKPPFKQGGLQTAKGKQFYKVLWSYRTHNRTDACFISYRA